MSDQRRAYLKGRLEPDRAARLAAVPGWTWSPLADRWDNGFAALKRFTAREGHTRVPKNHVEDGYALSAWVTRQRWAFPRGRLGAERIAQLEALPGWTWSMSVRNREEWGEAGLPLRSDGC